MLSTDPRQLSTLPPDALRPLASWFFNMGEMLTDAADAADKGKAYRARLKARKCAVFTAAQIAASYLWSGKSADQALALTSKVTGLEIEALRVAWPKVKKELDKKTRQQRNRQIVQLAGNGLTDKEIGRRVGMAEKSVSRIINQERKAA